MDGKDVIEIGACPVYDRHKVVADVMYSGLGKVAYGFPIVIQMSPVVPATGLYVVVQRYALGHRPFQAGGLDQCFAVLEGLNGPGLACGNRVQGVNNARVSSLGNLL